MGRVAGKVAIVTGAARGLGEATARLLARESDLNAEIADVAHDYEAMAKLAEELRIAQAQLVGWLEGLFHGIQAALFAQQMSAKAQIEEMRRQAAMPPQITGPQGQHTGPGQYL